MLQTFQIIAVIQGLFLLLYLFKNKNKYQPYNFWFLSALLLSLLFYIVGDDNNNLFLYHYDFFFVDKTLFVTLLFLFLKYFETSKKLNYSIAWYFIPTLIYILIELYETQFIESFWIEVAEHAVYLVCVIYLIFSLIFLKKIKIAKFIKTPFYFLIFSVLITDSLLIVDFLIESDIIVTLNSILIFEISILFYYLTYIFVSDHNFFDLPVTHSKYKNSSLNSKDIDAYKKRIIEAMEVDKLFTNENLSLQSFSETIHIPKHYISEILNIHLATNFQDFINEYRVEEFIKKYSNPENDHYSILGIATSVGFKNKATFNLNFKKFKGISPTEYKQNYLQ
ncbi:helix-turn-helix domain-containing protein [Flavobacterium urocaniciphilum]|uniref:AraC-type DNA-binding protein n=1 Tax=Flavobacterium urocaniciphilum TaxID=1299341 RepID=A0A1H9BSW1_9FLAO|nr:helix-turn-helix domain-containing protein [Flavobacterium urocaniciphilum]SEP92050.1 AraC-type DNA-binding protein [Flavobacterium urocaniciphilum]